MDSVKLAQIKHEAAMIRLGILDGVHAASSGHPGGSMSIADILAYLYFAEMKVDPENPKWENRDRFVLSKGHAAPALYAALACKGYFPFEELKTLRRVDSILQGHPDMKHIPGVDMTTGSLGQGISAAVGMALAAKVDGKDYRTYTIVGDGESEEGQVWEALMFAARHDLDNLCVIFDYNGLQIDGPVADIVNPAPYEGKLAAFGFHVITIDAHDLGQIENAFAEARAAKGKPTAIVANSVKGKGVSFMENQVKWHGSAPNDAQYEQAVAEIRAQM
ncbi:MAG: transketolase [Clostridia bacterium]|nr:transketolase [Clostridia bacterium]